MSVNMATLAHKAGVSLATVRKAHADGKVGTQSQQKIMAVIEIADPSRRWVPLV